METPQKTTPETVETPETMRLEWEKKQAEKERLSQKWEELRIEFRNFNTDERIAPTLNARSQLEKKARGMEAEIRARESGLCDCHNFLTDEILSVCSGKLSKKIYNRTIKIQWQNLKREFEKRYGKKQFATYLKVFAEIEERMLETINLNAFEAFAYLNTSGQRDKELLNLLGELLRKTKCFAETIGEQYRQVKKSAENELREAEKSKNDHNAEMMKWATDNHCRLQWILKNKLLPETDIINLYKKEHPDDDISNLLPIPPSMAQPARQPLYREKPKIAPPQRLPVNNNGSYNENEVQKQWQFFIGRGKDGPWQNIPIDKDEFLSAIRPYLTGKLSGLRDNLLHEKLLAITIMDIHQRQNIKRLHGKNLRDFQSIDMGIYRVLLKVEEIPRSIKFMVHKRAELYPKNKKK